MKIVHIHALTVETGDDSREIGEDFHNLLESVNPDLTVITGGLMGAMTNQEMDSDEIQELIRGRSDILVVPGPGDDRHQVERVFGRRYRIDPGYARLDRVAAVGGIPVILFDTADGLPKEEQILWWRSVMDDLTNGINRGSIGNRVLVFSALPTMAVKGLGESAGRYGVNITACCGADDESTVQHGTPEHATQSTTEAIVQYTVPPYYLRRFARIIEIAVTGLFAASIIARQET